MSPAKRTLQHTKASGLSRTTPKPAAPEKPPPAKLSAPKKARLGIRVHPYLRAVSKTARQRVKGLYREACGGELTWLNDQRRAILAECIFTVENEIEHRHANSVKPKKPKSIDQLNEARNRLYDELGWNEERA